MPPFLDRIPTVANADPGANQSHTEWAQIGSSVLGQNARRTLAKIPTSGVADEVADLCFD